jgi:ankyrin repeat protein
MNIKKFTLKDLFKVLVTDDHSLFTEFVSEYGINGIEKQDKRSILMYCILQKKNEYAIELIENGVDLNYQDKQGYTALHFAVQENSNDIVFSLLANGAKIDISDINGNTPLWRAMYNRKQINHSIIIDLLKAGANIHQQNNYGIAPSKYLDDSTEDVNQWLKNNTNV